MLSTYGKSRKTFTLSLGILPKIRKCVPLFQKNFHSHRVYFQKNWNRSRFFQIFPEKVVHRVYCQNFEKRSGFAELVSEKFAHIWYIAKNPENVLAFSELFWKSAHQVYFQNFWKRSGFSELFSKKFSLHWWLSEKVPQNVTPLSNFLQKNFYILTCHITDLEWFVCHFELKPSSGKVMSSPPCIELASCIQYICKKFENAPTFFDFFQKFLSDEQILLKNAGKILPERNFSKNSYIKLKKLHFLHKNEFTAQMPFTDLFA